MGLRVLLGEVGARLVLLALLRMIIRRVLMVLVVLGVRMSERRIGLLRLSDIGGPHSRRRRTSGALEFALVARTIAAVPTGATLRIAVIGVAASWSVGSGAIRGGVLRRRGRRVM
jgi:hypothetical protein